LEKNTGKGMGQGKVEKNDYIGVWGGGATGLRERRSKNLDQSLGRRSFFAPRRSGKVRRDWDLQRAIRGKYGRIADVP